MLLHEIIHHLKETDNSVLYETIRPYRKQLYIYFSKEYCTKELILLVTSITNAAAYVRIVSAEDLEETVVRYLGDEMAEDDKHCELETILFNSQVFNPLQLD